MAASVLAKSAAPPGTAISAGAAGVGAVEVVAAPRCGAAAWNACADIPIAGDRTITRAATATASRLIQRLKGDMVAPRRISRDLTVAEGAVRPSRGSKSHPTFSQRSKR